MAPSTADITELMKLAATGAPDAQARLFALLYADLRRLAAARMKHERGSHTLTATALVHEAYLRLVGDSAAGCRDRGHFFAIASQVMRRILVDHARARHAAKRAGGEPPDGLTILAATQNEEELLALDQALTALQQLSPRQCQVVELRYFGGLTEEQVAEALGLNRRTINRDWKMARAWLHARLQGNGKSA